MYLNDKKVESSFDGLSLFGVLGAYVPPMNDMGAFLNVGYFVI